LCSAFAGLSVPQGSWWWSIETGRSHEQEDILMRRVIIELDGVAVEAVLNEHKCPTFCNIFWDKLPYVSPVIHEMYSGRAYTTLIPLPIPDVVWKQFVFPRIGVEDRSFKTIMNPGDVVLYFAGETNGVCISYGVAQFFEGPAGPTYVNHLATIDKTDAKFTAFMEKSAEVFSKGNKVLAVRRKD
jgi:hypothetical protein